MKYVIAAFVLFAFVIVVGCSNSQTPVVDEPTIVPHRTNTSTVTSEPTATIAPTATQTATPTLIPSPIANPENLLLREKGYDVADVRYSYPREDILIVSFKYRLDERRKSKDTYIYMIIPQKCKGSDSQDFLPRYVAKDLSGEGQFTFKTTLQGVCDADSIEFVFYSVAAPPHPPFLYSELVLQPYHLVRSFPTLNSDMIEIQNFQFTPRTNWSGTFTFDYDLSQKIPLPLEQYIFVIRGHGADGGCAFWTQGPLLTEHSGKYEIDLNLANNLLYPYRNCLKGLDHYTYTITNFSVVDELADTGVYSRVIDTSYTLWEMY